MALNGPATFLPTIDLFLAHWLDVDTFLGLGLELKVGQPSPVAGASPILVPRATLVTLRASLQTARNNVTNAAMALTVKREDLKDRKASLLGRFHQFTALVKSRYEGKAYERSLPPTPGVGYALEKFVEPMQKGDALWVLINGTLGATPLQIDQGVIPVSFYTQSAFATELLALRTAAKDEQTLEQQLKTLIEKRTDVEEEIRPLLRDYRQAVQGRFAGGHAFVESLPRYSPVGSGKPAAPVLTSAAWNAATAQADVTFTPSTSGDVVRHELRVVPGDVYDPNLETIDATLAAGEDPEFHSSSLLGTPGAMVTYVIVAIDGDDQEAASEPMTVQRPV